MNLQLIKTIKHNLNQIHLFKERMIVNPRLIKLKQQMYLIKKDSLSKQYLLTIKQIINSNQKRIQFKN